MLMKFTVDNFKNFKGKYTLDLSTPNNYEFNKEAISEDCKCITKGIVYGPNGSGKSNLGLAIFDIVTHLTDTNVLAVKYNLYNNLESKKTTVEFEYKFDFKGHELVYHYIKQDIKTLLLEQVRIDGNEVVYYDYRLNEGYSSLKGSETLNLVGKKNNQISRVKYILGTALLADDEINNTFLSFGDYVNHMLLFYSLDDRGYEGFKIGSDKLSKVILEQGKIEEFEEFLKSEGIYYSLVEKELDGEKEIYCRFPNGDVNFFTIASTGTNSLALFYYWYIQMKLCSFVFIDEFDAFYHFELAESLVKKLKELKKTQIILTTHNTDLMTNDLLRPDCYFLIGNNRITSLNNATEKELRKAHNLQKMYKAGAFS